MAERASPYTAEILKALARLNARATKAIRAAKKLQTKGNS